MANVEQLRMANRVGEFLKPLLEPAFQDGPPHQSVNHWTDQEDE